jgi:hypothetical protein
MIGDQLLLLLLMLLLNKMLLLTAHLKGVEEAARPSHRLWRLSRKGQHLGDSAPAVTDASRR